VLTESRWYTAREVARILEVTPQRVSQMTRDEILPHYRIGRTVKIDREEFHAWLESQRRGPLSS
jgi:excisionase family DNA binding protein